MFQVFISYSRKNLGAAKLLIQDLEALGHEVWFDQELAGGQVWWDQVLAKIRACDLFLFVLAPEALDSQACKLECAYAFDLGKRILPVLVSDVSLNVLPLALSAIQFVDLRNQDKAATLALVKALNSLPPPKSLPDPLPTSPEVPISYLGNLKDQIEMNGVLAFQEQTALLFKLKEHLRDPDTANDARDLLIRLRKRDDLFAKIAAEIDVAITSDKPQRIKEPTLNKKSKQARKENEQERSRSDWHAKLLSKGWTERSIRVYLTHEQHVLNFRRRHWKLWNNWEVSIDGQVVVKGAHDFTDEGKLHFRVRDGSKEYPTTIEATMTGMERLKSLRLRVDGRILYDETE